MRHPLYAVVDLARAPRLYPLIKTLHPLDAPCLFAGKLDEGLVEVSPHVLALRTAPRLADLWRNEGVGQSWGIFVESPHAIEGVRRHLRHFTQVRLPSGEGPVLFRFWDPRVFQPFLSASEPDHLRQLFEKVSAYLVEVGPNLFRATFDGARLNVAPANWAEIA